MGVRVRVEAIPPEAQVVPVRRERRAEIDAGHRFLPADLQDLVVEVGVLVGAGRQARAQVRKERDRDWRAVRPALGDEPAERASDAYPVRILVRPAVATHPRRLGAVGSGRTAGQGQ